MRGKERRNNGIEGRERKKKGKNENWKRLKKESETKPMKER
jgi:hypothetical protein